MTPLKERFKKWKETRNLWQKAGDVFFWILLILLLIPGPRKAVMTTVNRLALPLKNPGLRSEEKQVLLKETDYLLQLEDLRGQTLTLDDFQGDVLFLNFWATWCPPCVAELPEIRKAHEKHGEQVRFLLVTQEQPERVRAFLEKRGEDLPVYFARGPLPPNLQASAIPTTYIVSRDGRIVTRKTGAANWDSRATDKIFRQLLSR
ncbi:MAG: TlpA disulfide reductase family protein [Bacteroidales bacterium]